MAAKKTEPQGIVYGAEQQSGNDGGRQDGLFYAVVYDRRSTTEEGGEMYRGTSGYKDAYPAETEAHAWCRDRGYTARPF